MITALAKKGAPPPGAVRYSKGVPRLVVPGALAAVTAGSTLPAAAQAPATERVHIVHQAGSGCPGSAAFHHEVAARVRRPVEWVQEGASTVVRVQLASSPAGATGQLEMTQAGGAPTRRDFSAETCAEVSSALALVVALALDPNAHTEPLLAEPSPPPSEPPPSPVTRDPPPVTRAPPRPSAAARAPLPPRTRFFVGPAAGIAGGYVPTGLVTLGAVLGLDAKRRGWLSPLAQLTPLWAKTGTTGPRSPHATFAWALLRVDACPTRLALGSGLMLFPCASGEAGQVSASGRDDSVDVPESRTRAWVALGPSLSLRFEADRWFFALSGGALAPLTRDEFVFEGPTVRIHEVPAVVFGGLLGVGMAL